MTKIVRQEVSQIYMMAPTRAEPGALNGRFESHRGGSLATETGRNRSGCSEWKAACLVAGGERAKRDLDDPPPAPIHTPDFALAKPWMCQRPTDGAINLDLCNAAAPDLI
jgi:hypothetical protein